MSTQKILSSTTILRTPPFRVEKEILLDHNDKKHEFYSVYSASQVVSVIPITPKGDIYLIDQYRFMLEKRILGIVAGTVEEKESPLAAAKRELQEEAGISATQWELLATIQLARGMVQQTHYLFLAKDLVIGQQDLKDEEDIDVVKLPLREAVEKVMKGEIYHSVSMAGILMLDKLKQQKRL